MVSAPVRYFYVGKPCSWSTFLRDGHMWNISTILCYGNMAKHSEGFILWVSFSSQKRTKIAVIHRGAGGRLGTFLSSSLSFSLSLNWLFLCLKCFHWIKDAKPNPFPFSLSHTNTSRHTKYTLLMKTYWNWCFYSSFTLFNRV